jgi:type IV pilus assembly protein PilC
MNSYRYKAINSQGEIIKGSYLVDTESQLISIVCDKGLHLISYKLIKAKAWTKIINKVTAKDLALLCKQLAQILKCGINISEGLKILYNEKLNFVIRNALYSINSDVQKGKSIFKSFGKFPDVFPKFMLQLIYIGEQSGNLEQVFEELSEYYAKQYALNKKIGSMLMYPLVVLITIIIFTTLIIMKIVPEFSKTLIDFGQEIPNSIKKLLFLSNLFNTTHYKLFLVLSICIAYYFVIKGYHRKLFYRIKYKLPIIRRIFLEINQIQFARNLKLLINSGITLIASLEAIRDSEANSYIKDILDRVIDNIKSGEKLSTSLYSSKIFKDMFTSMVAIGEDTGSLEEMLNNIADMYESNVDETILRITKLIEPIIIISLAIIIIIIILNLILPLFNTMYSFDSLN